MIWSCGCLHKNPEARPVSAEVVVKEIRTIERELLAERQKAELSAAAPLIGRRGGSATKLRRESLRKRARRNRRRRLKLAGVRS